MANDNENGVWRTIGGRRVFIKEGQSLADAMIKSGKFKNLREDYRKAKEEDENKKAELEKIKEDLSFDKGYSQKINDDTIKHYNQSELKKLAEKGDKPFELNEDNISETYKSYREKRDNLEGITKDELGNKNYDTRKDAEWTGKEYTNDEFLANLEDENWHTERRMLLEAGLTEKQMEFVKDNTKFHNGSPSLDREITEELIKGAKGEKYKTPDEIKANRNKLELEGLQKDLDNISKYGKYDENGNSRENIHTYRTYDELKDRYKQLTGKEYDDSDIKIPYDPKKTYSYPNGLKIDQNLMKDRYSGKDPEEVLHDIEFNKKYLMNYNPKERELHNAEIKEMEKYYNSMEKYESRISDDFGTKDWKEGYSNQFGGNAWKGTKSDSGLYGKDKIKAIDDEIKKAYPDLKTSRTTGRGGYTDSFSYRIMESDEPIVRNIKDFSDTEIERLWNKGYNKNYYKTKDEFKDHIRQELESGHFSVNEYNIKDDYRLTPYGKQVFKDVMKVSNAYNYDESDSMTDYFNTGHYINLSVGKDGKPYKSNDKFYTRKDGTKEYDPYKGTKYEKKYDSMQDVANDPNSAMNQYIRSQTEKKAYNKYMKAHPGSKMTFDEYKNSKK